MIPRTQFPNALRDITRWLPVKEDHLRVFLAAVLANVETRVSVLVTAPELDLASNVVSLLDGWRFAAPPASLTSHAIRKLPRDVRVVQVHDGSSIDSPAKVRALQELAPRTPVVYATSDTRFRTVRALLPWLACRFDESIEPEVSAARLRLADNARRAVHALLNTAIVERSALEQLETPENLVATIHAAASIVGRAEDEGHDVDRLAAQLLAVVRQLAFLAGERSVTVHHLRRGIELAFAQLRNRTRSALRFACHPERVRIEWPLQSYAPNGSVAAAKLADLARRGLLIATGQRPIVYSASPELRELGL